MIEQISIKNFRCYHDTTIKGFKRVNLIGGLNNSGKTVLLEAVLLGVSPTVQDFRNILQLRGEDEGKYPEFTWDNLFFNKSKAKPISISVNGGSVYEKLFIEYFAHQYSSLTIEPKIESNEEINQELSDVESSLKFFYEIDKETIKRVMIAKSDSNGIHLQNDFIINNLASVRNKTNYIPAILKLKPSILAKEYGISEKNGKEDNVLDALKIIDKRIEAIRVSALEGRIELKRTGEKFLPATMFGDAINKILNIVLLIVNNNGSILLIDEIENGMHYTVQKDFWRFLFQIAELFDVQVFATTHSMEMLQAFTEVANKEFENEAAYFELFKREITNEIDYNLHELKTLEYELARHLEVRGEII